MRPVTYRLPVAAVGLVILALSACLTHAQPTVANGGFEADRYAKYPGYADTNGKQITGWAYNGHVGVNPVHPNKDAAQAPAPFADNATVPQGAHVLFMQNTATLSQTVAGLEGGRRYRIHFRENARAYNQSGVFPKLTVRLGGKTIVSPHLIMPVCKANQRDLPYARVVSDVFAAPASGEYDLVFETMTSGGVSVLIDDVAIREAAAETE